MRKSFITKEYSIEPRRGTVNMKEGRVFFGSKMLEIEDEMVVGTSSLVWTESSDRTQGIKAETETYTFSPTETKKGNHSIRLQPRQSETAEYPLWEMTINIREIIKDYLFAQLKVSRAFENIKNEDCYTKNINNSITQYINDNIFPRIEFYTVRMYIEYQDISSGSETVLKKTPVFDDSITAETANVQVTPDSRKETATVVFKQSESVFNYSFKYYFDVLYKKS